MSDLKMPNFLKKEETEITGLEMPNLLTKKAGTQKLSQPSFQTSGDGISDRQRAGVSARREGVKLSQKISEETQRRDVGVRQSYAAREPSVGERIGSTLSGTLKQQVAGHAGTAEDLLEILGGAGSWLQDKKEAKLAAQDREYLAQYEKELADALATGDEEAAKWAQIKINQAKYRLKTSGDLGDYYDEVNRSAVQTVDAFGDKMSGAAEEDFERAKQGAGTLGKIAVDAGAALADVGVDAAANLLLPGLGTLGRISRTYGQGSEQAEAKGLSLGQQVAYGAASAGLGELTNRFFSSNPILEKATGKGALDDLIMPNLGKTLPGSIVKSGLGEAFEEGVENIADIGAQKLIMGDQADELNWKDVGYDALIGGLVGGVTGVSRNPANATKGSNTVVATGTREGGFTPGQEAPAEGISGANAGSIKAGRVTTIRSPYSGETPTQTKRSGKTPVVPAASIESAKTNIQNAQNESVMTNGNGFKTLLMKMYEKTFRRANGVPVANMSYGGKPYTVNIGSKVPGKVISDPNLSAEKLALLDMLPEIVQNGEYVGSGTYEQHSGKNRPGIRYDYFETPVEINGRQYVAKFDVEVLPGTNNYRTHQVVNMDLIQTEASLAGIVPAASSNEPSPLYDNTVSRVANSVNVGNMDPLLHMMAGDGSTDDIMPKLDPDGTIAWERMMETVAPEKRQNFTQAKEIANRFGADLVVGKLDNGAAGEYRNGVVTIAPEAENPVRQVLVHELTHHMETSGLYSQFSEKVLGFIAQDMGVDVDALKQSIVQEYGGHSVELDSDGASRELVAKFAEDMLFQDERSIQRLLQTDRNLFQKVYDWIRDTIAKVKGTSEERFLIDAQNLYEKALRQAGTQSGAGVGQNTFGGVNARTADLSALQTAQQLERQGSDANSIRQQTGWFRGMDGKWRFEIDDSAMTYDQRGVPGSSTLKDYIQHDALFAAYPELADVEVVFADLGAREGANYNPRTNTITINSDMRSAPEGEIIHEVQHAIQKAEGFTGGTSRDYWERRMMEDGYSKRWSGSYEEMMPSELYRNTAGEIEARDAAARRQMTAEERGLRMPQLGDENTVFAEGAGTASEIVSMPDGKKYVRADRQVILGNDPDSWGEQVEDYINGKIRKGQNVQLTTDDGDVLILTAETAGKASYPYRPDGSRMSEAEYETKLNAETHIDELAQISERGRTKADKNSRHGAFAERGWNYRTAYFRDFDDKYYRLRISVAQGADGNVVYNVGDIQERSLPTVDGSSAKGGAQNGKTSSEDIIRGEPRNVNDDIMPKLTRHDEGQFSMGRSFSQLVEDQRNGVGPDIMPKLEDAGVQPGDSGTEGYMDALAQDENVLSDDPLTPADSVYDAKLSRLQREEAPPESVRERVAKRDLDELVQLYQDVASPVDTARSARFEASEGLISSGTAKERKGVRQQAAEAKSYFMRKMVDAGDSVTRLAKAVKDDYLYPFYNMARSSASAGINMIQNEQTDITGKKVGESLNDIFSPIREKGDKYYEQLQTYLFDLHNIDRMSLVSGDNTARLEVEMALQEFDREHPDVATLTEARLQRKAESIDTEEAALAKERIRLLRKLNQADRMGNKPVFGWDVTADMSKERSDRLLREHPEFAQYREQVRQYIRNLMQYRVDSGLMTAEDAAFLEKYYPNYVPTFRATEKGPSTKDKKSVKVGKTVGLAEGGNQKLVPLHEALGKQTMQVVREGSKNRFGTRLLEDYVNNSEDGKVRKYILEAKEYESDFSTETFDQPDIELKKDNTFTVYKDGKKYEMTVDPSMFDAVKALYPDAQESNVAIKAIRAGNNLFKALVTGYNPTFTVRNTVRDLQTAGMYSRDGAAFAKNYPLALREIATDGEFWKQYKALGGSFSSVFDYQTGTVKEPDGKVAKAAAKLEALNMAMEQAPRLAEFMSVVKAGDGSMENLMDAMHAAADVTVNFGRAGTLGKVLNANFVPFLNPGIQGFDKMIRRVTETKGAKEWAKLAVRAAALGVAPTVLNGLLYADDEDWEDLRDSDKDANYMFKIGDGIWLKIPKGRELSILGMTADRVQDVVNGEDVDWGDFITTVGNQVAPANPLRQNILAAWFDTDLFNASSPGRAWYGGDIESQRLQNYAPGERYDSSTDIFSKWVGQQLNLSPKKINYLLDQYTGVVGDFVLPLLTPQAERDMFTKAFTVDSVSSNQISSEFYEKSDELTYAKNGGDTTSKVLSRFWSKQQSAASDIYAQIREIEGSDMSDAEKKEKVREARVVLNGIQKNALAVLDTYQDTVEKHLNGTSDAAVDKAYREANRECFGAEYALEVYNKDTYAKAVQANQNGVSYDDFYTYYFDTKDYEKTSNKSANTQKMEYLKNSRFDSKTQAELYFANLASDSDLKKQAELETSSGITAEEYWQYKVATSGMTKKAEKLVAIDSLDLTADQKTALYYANNWAESTLDEAPWISGSSRAWDDIMPRLEGTAGAAPKLSQSRAADVDDIMPKLVK